MLQDVKFYSPEDLAKFSELGITPAGIDAWLSSPVHDRLVRAFDSYPPRSLLSNTARAFLYHCIVCKRPRRVLKIGTYRAGTTEVLARAMNEIDCGELYTIDPYGDGIIQPILEAWPENLRSRVRFQPTDSMIFLSYAFSEKLTFDMIFIDGNHDY